MVFSSLEFLYIFFPACLVIYFAMPNIKAKNVVLTVVSLIFYAFGEPVWVALLVISALVDYVNGIIIEKWRGTAYAKAALVASLVINIGILFAFKYLNFVFGTLGLLLHTEMPVSGLVLPIGISFYTFQTLSYTIDVYKGKVKVQRSFMDFLLFVSLFPQLVAGPILRYSELEKQLTKRFSTPSGIAHGLTRFMIGLGKKVLIANFCGRTADAILQGDLSTITVTEAWLGILCYTFQIYFDFSGYSDMAIGLGRIFGFRYGENFRYPYISRSVTEFWRRWHISLGAFFRDYVYIPLGGNRKLQARNIMVVWLLTGLWHGASWNFVLWGVYFGLLLMLEKYLLKPFLDKLGGFAVLYAFPLAVLGWVLFYNTDITRAGKLYSVMLGFSGQPLSGDRAMILLTNNAPLIILAFIAASPIPANLGHKISNVRWLGTAATVALNAAILVLSTAALVGETYNPFLYFRF